MKLMHNVIRIRIIAINEQYIWIIAIFIYICIIAIYSLLTGGGWSALPKACLATSQKTIIRHAEDLATTMNF
jgi:hypothetical protein